MKDQTYFHIPTPCHENWDNMTPEGQGRFCGSCSKQVVDFSLMSDQQVLNYFKHTTGNTCGRFANDQLQRAMLPATEQKKKALWIAAMMPLLMLFGKVNAQKKKNTTQGTPVMVIPDNRPEIMGKVAPGIRPDISMNDEVIVSGNCYRIMGDTILSSPLKDIIITGNIINREDGTALPFVSVKVKDAKIGAAANEEGHFSIKLKSISVLPTLILSSVGYDDEEVDLSKTSFSHPDSENIVVNLSMKPMSSDYITVGMVIVHAKVKKVDTIKTTVSKIFRKEQFKIFPNPAQSGSSVKLEIQKSGDYSIQLLDNNAKLILVKKVDTANDKTLTEIMLPYDVTPGMYYIVLIDEKKKKQYTDKLIVQ